MTSCCRKLRESAWSSRPASDYRKAREHSAILHFVTPAMLWPRWPPWAYSSKPNKPPTTSTNDKQTNPTHTTQLTAKPPDRKEVTTMNKLFTNRLFTSCMALALMLVTVGNHVGIFGSRFP